MVINQRQLKKSDAISVQRESRMLSFRIMGVTLMSDRLDAARGDLAAVSRCPLDGNVRRQGRGDGLRKAAGTGVACYRDTGYRGTGQPKHAPVSGPAKPDS